MFLKTLIKLIRTNKIKPNNIEVILTIIAGLLFIHGLKARRPISRLVHGPPLSKQQAILCRDNGPPQLKTQQASLYRETMDIHSKRNKWYNDFGSKRNTQICKDNEPLFKTQQANLYRGSELPFKTQRASLHILTTDFGSKPTINSV